jgi:uracil-DNA glycosylase
LVSSVPLVATIHPSAVLRAGDDRAARFDDLTEDLRRADRLAG